MYIITVIFYSNYILENSVKIFTIASLIKISNILFCYYPRPQNFKVICKRYKELFGFRTHLVSSTLVLQNINIVNIPLSYYSL